jgi:oxygen-independent coproporphyrinogen-3 oxidase
MNSNTQLMTESFFRASGLAADFAAESRLGIYVHVPFCPHICPYCDFVKTAKFSRADVSAYFSQLIVQFDVLCTQVPDDITTVTVYLGGGTPSLFPAAYYQPLIQKISSRFRIEEFTVETNPFTNSNKAFSEWTALGATRMTLGAQSLSARRRIQAGSSRSDFWGQKPCIAKINL